MRRFGEAKLHRSLAKPSAQIGAKVAHTAPGPLAQERTQRRPIDVTYLSGHGFQVHAAMEQRLGVLHA